MNSPTFSWSGDIQPALICLVIVGIAITYAIIFALARRETKRHHAQTLDMHAANVGLERMQNETNEALASRIRDAMQYQPQGGNRHAQTMSMVDVENAFARVRARKGQVRGSKPLSARAIMFRGSIHGALIMSAANSLHQDYLGRDAYIELVQTRWVDARVTVPIAIVVLVIGFVAYVVDTVRSNGDRS